MYSRDGRKKYAEGDTAKHWSKMFQGFCFTRRVLTILKATSGQYISGRSQQKLCLPHWRWSASCVNKSVYWQYYWTTFQRILMKISGYVGIDTRNYWGNFLGISHRHLHSRFVIVFFSFCIAMMSWWARWRLKSPVSLLFTQPFVQAKI